MFRIFFLHLPVFNFRHFENDYNVALKVFTSFSSKDFYKRKYRIRINFEAIDCFFVSVPLPLPSPPPHGVKCGRMCSTGTYLSKCRQFFTQGFPLRNLFTLLYDLVDDVDEEMAEEVDAEEDKEGHRKGGHALRKNLGVIIIVQMGGGGGGGGAFEKKELRNA
jgi:hypothetical protein